MPTRLKRLLVFALCVIVAWYAHRPLLGAGFLGSDAAVLDAIDGAFGADARGPWSVEALDHRPVAASSLELSRSWHASDDVYTPGDAGRLRLEGLILLVIAAFGVRATVIRAMRPWTGEDHARAAGAASSAFLLVHPLLVPVAAHLPARGDAIALATSSWSVALLLAGRQERGAVRLVFAFLLAVVAAGASPAALLLVPLGLGLELIAARRHRPVSAKLRTAGYVASGYALALAVEFAVRHLAAPEAALAKSAPTLDPQSLLDGVPTGFLHMLAVAAEKTGVVVLPVNITGIGTLGYVLAVFALLAALHPGFVAARAAPRLWGRMLAGWAAALILLLVIGSAERVNPANLGDVPGTLSLAVCMAVGLGISSTALSGARRTVLPVTTGLLYAFLSAGSAKTIESAAAEVGLVHESILEAGRQDGWAHPIVVLDPPRVVAGVNALRVEDESSLASRPFLPLDAQPVPVRGVPSESAWILAGDPDTPLIHTDTGSLLLLPTDPSVLPEPPEGPPGLTLPTAREGPRPRHAPDRPLRRAILVLPHAAQAPPGSFDVSWVGEGASPAGRRFDPFRFSVASADVPPDVNAEAALAQAPIVRWTGTTGAGPEGTADGTSRGIWTQGPNGPRALFHLAGTTDWTLAGTVRSVWFPGVLRQASAAQLAQMPTGFGRTIEPRVVGADWTFDLADVPLIRPLDPSEAESWVLWIVDRASGAFVEVAPEGATSGRLVVPNAAAFHGEAVTWVLERRLGGVVVQQTRASR